MRYVVVQQNNHEVTYFGGMVGMSTVTKWYYTVEQAIIYRNVDAAEDTAAKLRSLGYTVATVKV